MDGIVQAIFESIGNLKLYIFWKNFQAYEFALYNKEKVYFSNGKVIDWNNRFIGNTAIKYEDNYIAIWNLDTIETIDIDVLSASMIHEMFHAFQYEKQEKRWPKEIDGLFYEYNPENLSIKLEESKLLIELLDKFNQEKWDIFLRSRMFRKKHYSTQYDYETRIEVVEGMAEFVELEALKQLSKEKYNKRIENLKQSIIHKQSYLEVRILSYHVGSLLMTLCKENDIEHAHDISTETKTISDILIKRNDYMPLNLLKVDYFSKIIQDKEKKEVQLFEKKREEMVHNIEGPFELVGFDPLNTIRLGNSLYCKHFIAYKNKGEIIFFTNECIVTLKDKQTIEAIQYTK